MENNGSGQPATCYSRPNPSSAYREQHERYREKRSTDNVNQQDPSRQKSGAPSRIETVAPNLQKTVKTFRDLAIWQKGFSLVKVVYQRTGPFPKEELYGLVSQMRRAAVSIPSNIAEGYRRRHAKEFQQFLNIALGSLGELETQTLVSSGLNYLSKESEVFLLEEIDHLARMIISLNKKVDR